MAEETKNIGLRGITVADTHVSMVDGVAGKLFYRGYAIQDLAAQASFEEVIYLLLKGRAPNVQELAELSNLLQENRTLPKEINNMLRARPQTAAPMDVMQGAVTGLADIDPDLNSKDRDTVYISCLRLISRFATTAAAWQRIRNGKQPVALDKNQSHAAAFLQGLWNRLPTKEEAKLMDLLLILHADHTFNASTFAVREVTSTQAHLYASVSAGVGALSGALHGGANAKVMQMLLDIGSPNNVESWVTNRLAAGERIMGLGHAVYKTEDPRAAILRQVAEQVLAGKEAEQWFRLSLQVEKIGRQQLQEKKNRDLYPNVDFYSSPVLYGLGLPIDMFPVFFAVSRVSGWCAHYLEECFAEAQPKPALYRPKAEYTGRLCEADACEWIPLNKR
jgi:citrate synthase